MFQDSLTEGHLYWGRFVAIVGAAVILAYFISQL